MTTRLERLGRYRSGVRKGLFVLFVLAVCTVSGSGGQWSRQPGDRVRDTFGPTGGFCRGACGMGCPAASCEATVTYECAAPDRLLRVRTFACGTHQGCREHDDCLDRCRMRGQQGFDCEAQCHTEAIEQYGFETGTSWARGGGPFDAQRITFEYTRDSPDTPQPLFSCPDGARLSCGSAAGRCVTAAGTEVTPVFDSYAGGKGMRVSGFRSGRVCRDGDTASGVCEQTIDMDVTADRVWYGFEFDYANADPSVPLLCSSSGAEDDFMGTVVKSMLTFAPADDSTEFGKVFGQIQHELGSGRSLTDVLAGIKVKSAGQPASVAETPAAPAPGVPLSVRVPSASGHLLVPMFEPSDAAAPGSTLLREVRCTHGGSPVLEATFRLHFRGR